MDFIFELIADLFLGEEDAKSSLPTAENVDANNAVQLAVVDDGMGFQDHRDNLFGIMEFH